MRNVYERVFVPSTGDHHAGQGESGVSGDCRAISGGIDAVSYTHLRAHET